MKLMLKAPLNPCYFHETVEEILQPPDAKNHTLKASGIVGATINGLLGDTRG